MALKATTGQITPLANICTVRGGPVTSIRELCLEGAGKERGKLGINLHTIFADYVE